MPSNTLSSRMGHTKRHKLFVLPPSGACLSWMSTALSLLVLGVTESEAEPNRAQRSNRSKCKSTLSACKQISQLHSSHSAYVAGRCFMHLFLLVRQDDTAPTGQYSENPRYAAQESSKCSTHNMPCCDMRHGSWCSDCATSPASHCVSASARMSRRSIAVGPH